MKLNSLSRKILLLGLSSISYSWNINYYYLFHTAEILTIIIYFIQQNYHIHSFCYSLLLFTHIFKLFVKGCVVLEVICVPCDSWRGCWWRRWGQIRKRLSGHCREIFSLESLQGRQAWLLGQDVGRVLSPVVVVVIPGQSVVLHGDLWSPSSDGRLGTGQRWLHLSTSYRTSRRPLHQHHLSLFVYTTQVTLRSPPGRTPATTSLLLTLSSGLFKSVFLLHWLRWVTYEAKRTFAQFLCHNELSNVSQQSSRGYKDKSE